PKNAKLYFPGGFRKLGHIFGKSPHRAAPNKKRIQPTPGKPPVMPDLAAPDCHKTRQTKHTKRMLFYQQIILHTYRVFSAFSYTFMIIFSQQEEVSPWRN